MFEKTFTSENSRWSNPAHTLDSEYFGDNDSGWVVEGEVKNDYYSWINEFVATHPKYGRVWGDFEETVYADSEEGYSDFIKHHPPEKWDYRDI